MQMPKLMPTERLDQWVLAEDWECLGYTVKKGFVSDLDSIPRAVPLLYSFLKGHVRAEALLHDWLYRTGEVSRSKADKLFLQAMLQRGHVDRFRAYLMYLGVRVFGRLRYRPDPESVRHLYSMT